MDMTMDQRPIDQRRAALMVAAAITEDTRMFLDAVDEMIKDTYGAGGIAATINVLRSLAEDLGGILVDVHGRDDAAALVRMAVARFADEEHVAGDRHT